MTSESKLGSHVDAAEFDEFSAGPPSERFSRGDTREESFFRAVAARHSLDEIWNMSGMLSEAEFDARYAASAEFKKNYFDAMEILIAKEALRAIEIADDQDIPTADRQLMISTRRWVAEKVLPQFKERTEVTVNHGLTPILQSIVDANEDKREKLNALHQKAVEPHRAEP